MTTSDGRVRLFRAIQDIAGSLDRHHALKGIGVVVLFGNVLQPLPDLQVSVEGLTQITDAETFLLTADNLLVPDDVRLTRGDRIVLLPVQAEFSTKMLVICKMRTSDLAPDTDMRLGYNGDITTGGGGFVGVEIHVDGANENADSDVLIQGDSIDILSFGGAAVTIDGIVFKHHTHPGGGPPA